MENRGEDPNSPNHSTERAEPVRSRWTPKPEQILILESIFNSGTVNPPKDETVRIRKLLEKFGSVGDANVFYWFQNRRSRSRRRQRQMQAAATLEQRTHFQGGGAIHYDGGAMNFAVPTSPPSFASSHLTGGGSSSSSSSGVRGDDGGSVGGGVDVTLFPISDQMGFPEIEQQIPVTPSFCPSQTSNLQFQSGFIIIFINGVPTEVPKGPVDMKALFGQETVLVHSSGLPVLTNEFGISLQSLQHGESYFLVTHISLSSLSLSSLCLKLNMFKFPSFNLSYM